MLPLHVQTFEPSQPSITRRGRADDLRGLASTPPHYYRLPADVAPQLNSSMSCPLTSGRRLHDSLPPPMLPPSCSPASIEPVSPISSLYCRAWSIQGSCGLPAKSPLVRSSWSPANLPQGGIRLRRDNGLYHQQDPSDNTYEGCFLHHWRFDCSISNPVSHRDAPIIKQKAPHVYVSGYNDRIHVRIHVTAGCISFGARLGKCLAEHEGNPYPRKGIFPIDSHGVTGYTDW